MTINTCVICGGGPMFTTLCPHLCSDGDHIVGMEVLNRDGKPEAYIFIPPDANPTEWVSNHVQVPDGFTSRWVYLS